MHRFVITMIGVAIAGVVVCAQAGDADKGKAAFAEHKCGTCHKTTAADEKGGKMSTVLGDTVGKLSAADLKAWLTNTATMEAKLPAKPKVLMSSYLKNQKLTDADVANLVAYLRTLPAK